MSVIVAVKTDKGFVLGADRRVTIAGNQKREDVHKIFTFDDCPNTVMGGVGRLNIIQGISLMDNIIPEVNRLKDNVNTKLIYTTVFPNIIEQLKSWKRIKTDNITMPDSEIMLAYKDKCWIVCSDGCTDEINDYWAIGSGEEVALGSLAQTKDLDPEERVRKAVMAAGERTIYVNTNVEIYKTYDDTKDKKSKDKESKEA